MGNSLADIADTCGVPETFGFQNTSRALISYHGIEPWPARELVRYNLQRQAALARSFPFKQIPVAVGMKFFKNRIGGWGQSMTREAFVQSGRQLLDETRTRHSQDDLTRLYDIFDAMDLDDNGELSIGEWAGALTVFFKGTQTDCVRAVFECLDTNGDHTLDKRELMEYLRPFVLAMSPPEAAPLRQLLLRRASDQIFEEMDLNHDGRITGNEMLSWSQQPGNNIVNALANIIEQEVFSLNSRQGNRQRTGYRRESYDDSFGSNDPRRDSYGSLGNGNGDYSQINETPVGSTLGPGRDTFSQPAYDGYKLNKSGQVDPYASYNEQSIGSLSPVSTYYGAQGEMNVAQGRSPSQDFNSYGRNQRRPRRSPSRDSPRVDRHDPGDRYDRSRNNKGTGWGDIVRGTVGHGLRRKRNKMSPTRGQFHGSSDPRYGGYASRDSPRNNGPWNGQKNSFYHDSIYGGGY